MKNVPRTSWKSRARRLEVELQAAERNLAHAELERDALQRKLGAAKIDVLRLKAKVRNLTGWRVVFMSLPVDGPSGGPFKGAA